jgi:DMSO/TMAO reductase YedYZ molybdopterin-dependent catalytic subunit
VVGLGSYFDISHAATGDLSEGTYLGNLDFLLEPDLELGRLQGAGLDGRRIEDLSALTTDRLITPTENFFVRTAVPDLFERRTATSLQVGGLVERPLTLSSESILSQSVDQGVHLLECAGNSRWMRFGLISVGQWNGVSIDSILDRAGPVPAAAAIRVDGFDEHSRGSTNSTIGCSWVFPLEDLRRSGAFIATQLNGEALPLANGAPMRLIVPGWYGCCCIKWVNRIEVVDHLQPATSQMTEFASRTHQTGDLNLASDFSPALIDMAAMPIRIERWKTAAGIRFRIVGVLWGGQQETDRLEIRTRPTDPFERVGGQPNRSSPSSWGLWSHEWSPPAPGKFLVQLRVSDPAIRTRRLDSGYYVRAVEILEI